MKQFVLQVPDNKAKFFLELLKSLGFVKTDEIKDISKTEVPEAHKALVRGRIDSARAEDLLDWEDAQQKLRLE